MPVGTSSIACRRILLCFLNCYQDIFSIDFIDGTGIGMTIL